MKICLINNTYPPYDRGGGSEQIMQIMKAGLEKTGHQVVVITCKPYFSQPEHKTNTYYINSLYHNLNKIPKIFRLIWHLLQTVCLYKACKIKRIINKEKCDLVISHNLEGLSYLTARFIKPKHVHILHDIQLLHPSGLIYWQEEGIIESFWARTYQTICQWCFAKTDLVVSPSQWLIKIHQTHKLFVKNKTMVMQNPRPEFKEKEKRDKIKEEEKKEENNKPFTFLSVGQIVKHKGIHVLIKAFEQFKKIHNLNSQLIIVGQGENLEKLKQDNPTCKFLGQLTNEKVLEQMQMADCLIVPSLCYENSPTIIFEASQNNLPVMASKIGGIPEILDYNPYLLFEPNNEEKLSVKMYWAVTHQEQLKHEFNQTKQKIKSVSVEEYLKILLK